MNGSNDLRHSAGSFIKCGLQNNGYFLVKRARCPITCGTGILPVIADQLRQETNDGTNDLRHSAGSFINVRCRATDILSGRRESRGSRPPTPPDVRFRIRRFTLKVETFASDPAMTRDPFDQRITSGMLRSCV